MDNALFHRANDRVRLLRRPGGGRALCATAVWWPTRACARNYSERVNSWSSHDWLVGVSRPTGTPRSSSANARLRWMTLIVTIPLCPDRLPGHSRTGPYRLSGPGFRPASSPEPSGPAPSAVRSGPETVIAERLGQQRGNQLREPHGFLGVNSASRQRGRTGDPLHPFAQPHERLCHGSRPNPTAHLAGAARGNHT